MKKTIILSESNFSKFINMINENTICLQFINGYFYPTNSTSKDILNDVYNLSRISEEGFDRWSPKIIHDGYKLAVNDYNPKPKQNIIPPAGGKIGGEPHPTKNPCIKCKMNGLCDSDECGMKIKRNIKRGS